MKRVSAAVLLMCLAGPVGAQCLGDFNGDLQVQINELIVAVNNALSGCGPPPCPIDFSVDNTPMGSTDCFYAGRWNATCGAADLKAQFISDGELVIIAFVPFDPGLFYIADVVSPTTAALFGWYQQPDASDLEPVSGIVLLEGGGATLVVDPVGAPFVLDQCDFERYDGALTSTSGTTAAAPRGRTPISAAALARVRAARATGVPAASLQRSGNLVK